MLRHLPVQISTAIPIRSMPTAEEEPVAFFEGTHEYFVTRFDDCRTVGSTDRIFGPSGSPDRPEAASWACPMCYPVGRGSSLPARRHRRQPDAGSAFEPMSRS